MSRIRDTISSLQSAEQQVLDVLAAGPIKTAELLDKLGHSLFNFAITKQIGDAQGEWDGCPHQLALSDLIDSGRVRWWKDAAFDVLYGLADGPGVPPASECGDNSPAIVHAEQFLVTMCERLAVGQPPLQFSAPFPLIREVWDDTNCLSVRIDDKTIQAVDYDFVVGAGSGEILGTMPWPTDDISAVVAMVMTSLSKVEQ